MNLFEEAVNLFKIISNLPAFINVISTAVIAVEQTGALGADKKAAVISAVDNFAKSTWNLDITGFNGIIGGLIDMIVDLYNIVGFFTHKSANTTK
ncbi:MAG: hypothetical protein ACP5L4_06655 [Thermoplasmata archaeon]